jgi:hypothetical protein
MSGITFDELCKEVNRRALRIYGQAGNGQSEKAAELAIELSDYISTQRQQVLMQQEQTAPGRFDLTALKVNASVGSDSETGYEDRG